MALPSRQHFTSKHYYFIFWAQVYHLMRELTYPQKTLVSCLMQKSQYQDYCSDGLRWQGHLTQPCVCEGDGNSER